MCPLCERVAKLKEDNDPALICEYKQSYLILGDHQYFKGYCVLILKEHCADPIELPVVQSQEFWQEAMLSARMIKKTFAPYKLNYAILGNEVEHLHLHLIPRYSEELAANSDKNPWANSSQFTKHRPSEKEIKSLVEKLQSN